MSQVIWSRAWAPSSETLAQDFFSPAFDEAVSQTQSLALQNEKITIPDPRAFRSMSRASLLLSSLASEAREILEPILKENPFSVGIYCAVENGPIDAASTVKILAEPAVSFSESYRKLRNPKLYLKQLPNLAPAQMGISLGILGRMNVYTHSTKGSIHALDQAEWDLKVSKVKYALVCSSHAFDDFLVVKRSRGQDPRALAEGVAVLILKKDPEFSQWQSHCLQNHQQFFGIADPLINLVKGIENGKTTSI